MPAAKFYHYFPEPSHRIEAHHSLNLTSHMPASKIYHYFPEPSHRIEAHHSLNLTPHMPAAKFYHYFPEPSHRIEAHHSLNLTSHMPAAKFYHYFPEPSHRIEAHPLSKSHLTYASCQVLSLLLWAITQDRSTPLSIWPLVHQTTKLISSKIYLDGFLTNWVLIILVLQTLLVCHLWSHS